MANKNDLDFTYSTVDKIFRLSIGETGDFSGARYKGNFAISLEEAQRKKHEYIASHLNIREGTRVLDMGCGWGPFINYATKVKGANCVGVTLSEAQAKSCRSKGFEVYIKDCRTLRPEDFGKFDAVVSLGAFEHFCSLEDYNTGKQDQVYKEFFRSVCNILNDKGRFYLQTMVFSKNMLPPEKITLHADKNSDEYMLALLMKQFPGSWLPYGSEMLLRNAESFFDVVDMDSGRLDYIETIKQWKKRFVKFNLKKYWYYAMLFPKYLFDPPFRFKLENLQVNPNKVCFEREIMDHFRIVFEKK